jgi:hypothetical protein
MSAPGVITRGTPAGAALRSGHKSKFALGALTTFALWEFEIAPGEWDGGDPIPFSSFFNTLYHTERPQTLIKIGPHTIIGKYDPNIFGPTMLPALINRETVGTLLWPDLGTLSCYGWLRRCSFSAPLREGQLPQATIIFNVSNWDYINHTEAGPSFADGYSGTSDS